MDGKIKYAREEILGTSKMVYDGSQLNCAVLGLKRRQKLNLLMR